MEYNARARIKFCVEMQETSIEFNSLSKNCTKQ